MSLISTALRLVPGKAVYVHTGYFHLLYHSFTSIEMLYESDARSLFHLILHVRI